MVTSAPRPEEEWAHIVRSTVGATVLTSAVATVFGIAIGVVGVLALKNTVSPSANSVSTSQENDTAVTKPQTYGSR